MVGSSPSGWRRARAASEVVGVVVLFGLVLVGAALIVYFGVSALDQVERQGDLEAAEDTLSEARADFRSLAVDDSTERVSLSLPGDDNALNVVDDGQMAFSLNGDPVCSATRQTGTLSYETDDGEVVAYQASGLWRDSEPGNATMVAPPNLDYRTQVVDGIPVRTLNVPITNVNASASNVSAATTLTAQRAGTGPNDELSRDLCLTGPNADRIDWVDNATIRVENNTFYRAWATFLRTEFTVDGTPAANVTVYDANRTVVVSDIPLGAVGDDDNDGYPDPDIDSSDPSLPDSLADYRANYADDPAIDNCPPEKDPGNSTRNPKQVNSDADNWGDACDGFGSPPSGPGNAPPTVQFAAATDAGNASTVVGDYTVNATDADGRVVSVSTALVAVDGGNGTVVATRDHPVSPNASQVTVSGALANASTADSYWLVAVARDRNGSTANVTTLVRDNGPGDGDGDGVPDPVDDCPNASGTGENGCAVASPVGPGGDDALAVNASSATVTLLGSSVAQRLDESVTIRPPVDVSFALDGTGSLQSNDPDKERVDATQMFLDELNSTIDRAGWIEFRVRGTVPGCSLPFPTVSDFGDCAESRVPLGSDFDDGNFISDSDVNQVGGTYIGAGIEYATSQVTVTNNSGKDIVVLLTDGRNSASFSPVTDQQLNQETLAQASDAASEGVTVYTVGLGNVNDTLLTQVANTTGGTYYPIGDDDELEDTFEDIAGNVTEGEDIKRIELRRVAGGVEVGGPGSDTVLGDDLNDPSTSPTTTVSLGNGTNTSFVSLSNVAYECEGGTTLVDNVTGPNGTTYERVTCPSNSTVAETIDNGTSGHEIYRDGDAVPNLGDAWYRDEIETTASGYIDAANNTFDLAPDQAVFVLRDGDNYTAVLFDASPSSPPGGGSPTPPSVGPTPPGGGGGSPVDGVENRFVIDIDGTEVVFEGDG